MDDKNRKTFKFGNERFGGSYTPGDFEFRFPNDMSRDEFEKMFTSRMESLHKKGNEFAEEFFESSSKSKKENLKPLSIRVKPHTKEFFKNHSILSPRDVLEMYEDYNNGSEAFINSLIEDEKQLEKELAEVQEKLHNAKLFKDKLAEVEIDEDILADGDKIAKIQNEYAESQIKSIGNESSVEKIKNDILNIIQLYNTIKVSYYDEQFVIITVVTDAKPMIYYFRNEYLKDDILEIILSVKKHCKDNGIEFVEEEGFF